MRAGQGIEQRYRPPECCVSEWTRKGLPLLGAASRFPKIETIFGPMQQRESHAARRGRAGD
ncbi:MULTISPECIES: hypothetical protein [unclassified Mesorhizobium]|uniref:hypothetical protein n=1 Tax=unclassified Mesorhizobium TaxID=325217 RepID=UPI001925DD0E|nr:MULTISPECIES: hypothetical protein [unclassified Mesorhizobium]